MSIKELLIRVCGPSEIDGTVNKNARNGEPMQPCVRRVCHDHSITLEVIMPDMHVDEDDARNLAVTLVDQIEEHESMDIDTVHFRQLRFTTSGAQQLKCLLLDKLSAVKIVDLIDLMDEHCCGDETSKAFSTIASAFKSAHLIGIDMSQNVVPDCPIPCARLLHHWTPVLKGEEGGRRAWEGL